MLRTILFILFLSPLCAIAQVNPFLTTQNVPDRDSILAIMQNPKSDLELIKAYRELAYTLTESRRDSALYYFENCILIARQNKWKLWEADAANSIGFISYIIGNYPRAMQFLLLAKTITEDPESEKGNWDPFNSSKENAERARLTILQRTHLHLGGLYGYAGDFKDYTQQELFHLHEALRISESLDDKVFLSIVNMNMARHYSFTGDADSVLYWEKKSLVYIDQTGYTRYKGTALKTIGDAHTKKANIDLAKQYYWDALLIGRKNNNLRSYGDTHLSLSELYRRFGNYDSSLYYSKEALKIFQATSIPGSIAASYSAIASAYQEKNNIDSAFKYQGLALTAKEALDASDKIKQFQNMNFDERLREEQLEKEKETLQNRIRTNALLGGVGTFLLIALLLLRNNRQRKKANTILQSQKEELSTALANLKTTQNQLIQSEKMASLGELTAGIAHEIQNPLNFVNNFSEVNTELLAELENELRQGHLGDAEEIIKALRENELKINHHGKRADAIVKSMLQHSHSSSGVKEPVDINVMADEYLRLAYHGVRAKDNSFNAAITTDFDRSIGNISIISQDIGRVLLNLINNAFYAIDEKKKSGLLNYEPAISISTKKSNGKAEITVADNGYGIPNKIADKIFQPFFTTKPTGQGTGLGLSLSYDIVKAHGGEIKVDSKEGQGSVFIIQLPIA